MGFCGEVCSSSCYWKFAFLFGLFGIAASLYGLVTPNFIRLSVENSTQSPPRDSRAGLFEACEFNVDSPGWDCSMYMKEDEPIYLLIARYVSLAAVVCGLFGVVCHFLSPLQRAYFKTFHAIFYFLAGVLTAIVGPAIFVGKRMDEIDAIVSISRDPSLFNLEIYWSFYAFMGSAGIFLVAAIFCGLEVRRAHRERRLYRENYMLTDRA